MPILNVKAVVAAFNQEKALVGAFSVMIGKLCEGSSPALVHSSQVVEDIK